MVDQSSDARIRELAYAIWQEEGCPSDQADRHWEMAARILSGEMAAPAPTDVAADAANAENALTGIGARPRERK